MLRSVDYWTGDDVDVLLGKASWKELRRGGSLCDGSTRRLPTAADLPMHTNLPDEVLDRSPWFVSCVAVELDGW